MMKYIVLFVFLACGGMARADLTIVQKVDGAPSAGGSSLSEIVIKMKGDKARIETGAGTSTIIDSKTGEMITLMSEQKRVIRISGERAKAMAEMATKYAGANGEKTKAKLTPTGKKETVNGQETEIFNTEGGQWKGTYWIARNYPNASAILAQMQAMQPAQWSAVQTGMPDFRDFPGMPIRTEIDLNGTKITTTLVSVKETPIADNEFSVPADYTEMKMPNFGPAKPGVSGTPIK